MVRAPRVRQRFSSYFTDPSRKKYVFYLLILVYVISTSLVVIAEPFLALPCDDDHTSEVTVENALYRDSPCNHIRYSTLLFFTKTDCLRGRHLLMAVALVSRNFLNGMNRMRTKY